MPIKVSIFTLCNLSALRGVTLYYYLGEEKEKKTATDVEKEFVLVIENHSNVRSHPQEDSKSPLTSQHVEDLEIFKTSRRKVGNISWHHGSPRNSR